VSKLEDPPQSGPMPDAAALEVVNVARGGGLNLAGSLVNTLSILVLFWVLDHHLGKTLTGVYIAAFALRRILQTIALGGMRSAMTRFVAIHLADKSQVFNTARVEALEVDNLMECALATMISAAARKECRGAHTVNDYERPIDDPQFPNGRNDAEWMKHTLWYSEGNRLDYKPVNLTPQTVESIPPKVRTF